MSGHYQLRPQAERDLDECAAYIAKDNLDAAFSLYDAAEETYRNLAQHPKMGRAYTSNASSLRNIRCFPIKGFSQYLVFYAPDGDRIDIIRVLNTARDIENILN